jgi:phage-related protein
LAVTARRAAGIIYAPDGICGSGVWELKEQDERKWYRVIYLSRIINVIYILHCFENQSRKTDRRDLETAKERLTRVRQRIQQIKGPHDARKNS